MSNFEKTEKNTVKRVPKRGHYDKETIYPILDEAFFCTVSFIHEGEAVGIPMLHAREGDALYLHGSTKSRLMVELGNSSQVCVSVTHFDGLVLARSVFHSSANYRSAVCFGTPKAIVSEEEKDEALRLFVEKLIPGRWEDARRPNAQELKGTLVVRLDMEAASAKIRTGPPIDDEDDYELDVWAGVLPSEQKYGAFESDSKLREGTEIPEYLHTWRKKL